MLSGKHKERNLQQKSVRGIKWQIITEVLARGFRLVTMFVLAHLLLPADFGLIGMALIFTQLAYVLFDVGLSVPLIQRKNLEPRHYQTAFSVYGVLAVVFYLLLFLLAKPVALFFKNELLISIFRILGFVFFFYALRGIATIRLTKQLRFRALGIIQLSAAFVYAGLAIILAGLGAGVWSFVIAILGQEAWIALASLLTLKEWYALKFSKKTFIELFGFSSTVFVARIMGYLNVNLPNIVIGRWLGETALGYYSVGYQLVDFPVQRISKNILRVMFPTLSRVQENKSEFNRFYLQTLRGMFVIIIPLFTGMAVIAPEFVKIFYGKNWHPLIPILQILTLVGLARSLWTLTSVVFLAKGKPQIELKVNLANFISLLLVLSFVYVKGLLIVVLSITALIFIHLIIFLLFSLRLMDMTFIQWLKSIQISVLGSLVMAVVLFLFRYLIQTHVLMEINLILMIVLGGTVYVIFILLMDPSLKDFISRIFKKE